MLAKMARINILLLLGFRRLRRRKCIKAPASSFGNSSCFQSAYKQQMIFFQLKKCYKKMPYRLGVESRTIELFKNVFHCIEFSTNN
jgi:hypothetical protein